MKIKRILAFAVVAIMMCLVLGSCSKAKEATVMVYFNVQTDTVDGIAKGTEIGKMRVTVKGTPPTALQAAQLALNELDFEEGYAMTADGYSVGMVKGIAENSETDATTGYYSYWRCSLNGSPTTEGRQSEIEIYEGDEITFDYISDSRPRQDNVYDSAENQD